MERRFYLGVGLLVLILALGALTAWVIRENQLPAVQLLEQAAVSEELEQGVALARQAKQLWQRSWKGVAAVADHTPMDEIDKLFAEMEVFARAKEDVHFSACCQQLASLLRAVSEAHAPTWWNFL